MERLLGGDSSSFCTCNKQTVNKFSNWDIVINVWICVLFDMCLFSPLGATYYGLTWCAWACGVLRVPAGWSIAHSLVFHHHTKKNKIKFCLFILSLAWEILFPPQSTGSNQDRRRWSLVNICDTYQSLYCVERLCSGSSFLLMFI